MDFGGPEVTRVRAPVGHNCVCNLDELWEEITRMKTALIAQVINLCQFYPAINLIVESVQQCSQLLD